MRCPSDVRPRPLRVGIVDYLNSRPLAWSFLTGVADDGFEVRFLPPASVADLLAAGELEIGLVPSIEVQRIPDLDVLQGLCVAATEEVRSVLLVSQCPIGDIRRLALDENSRTSAALVQILLRRRYAVDAVTVSGPARLDALLEQADAALIIGDPALRIDRTSYTVLDLAAEWRQWTGYPFVFAVWACHRSVRGDTRLAEFPRSLELGLQELDAIVDDATKNLGLARADIRHYLQECLSFSLGRAELEGLRAFYRLAAAEGQIAASRPLSFVDPCDPGAVSVE